MKDGLGLFVKRVGKRAFRPAYQWEGRGGDRIRRVEDVVRGRWTPAKRDEIMLRTAGRDAERHGAAGRGVKIWVEQEPGSGSLDNAQATIRRGGWG